MSKSRKNIKRELMQEAVEALYDMWYDQHVQDYDEEWDYRLLRMEAAALRSGLVGMYELKEWFHQETSYGACFKRCTATGLKG